MLCHSCAKYFTPYTTPRPPCLRTSSCPCYHWDFCAACLERKGDYNPDHGRSTGGQVEMWIDPEGEFPPQNLPPVNSRGVFGPESSFRCTADTSPLIGIPRPAIAPVRPVCRICQRSDEYDVMRECAVCHQPCHLSCATQVTENFRPSRLECNHCNSRSRRFY